MVKKLMISCGLLLLFTLAASAQTYEELTGKAADAIEHDSLFQAEEYIKQALKLDPSNEHNVLLFSNLGTIQRRLRKYDEALESYTFALNFAPRMVPVLLNRATLYMEMGKEELARADYSLVLDVDLDNQEALLMRAYIYMKHRNYPFARNDYSRLLKLNPQHYNGRLGLATLEQKERNYEAAISILNGMIVEYPEDALLYVARAGVENEMQHADLALIDLDEALRLDASLADAYLLRGQIYLAQGKKKPAKQDFEAALRLGVPHSDLRDLLRQCR